MNKDGSISINQTFHGYENGHSLIASSIELPSDVKRKMLPITDMSGNSILEGFEEYVTAYPIKEINAFAIGKTWYADEMERPGCVWTHTLIISFVDVPLLRDGEIIFNLFKRPKGHLEVDDYKDEINIKLSHSRNLPVFDFWKSTFTPSMIKTVIELLYNRSDKSILVRAAKANNYDRLILALWLQQWPRLKRNFSFCTGAIEPRTLDKQFLDIQVVPYRAFRESSSFAFLDVARSNDIKKDFFDSWINLVYEDLHSPTLLRDFLATYGADVSGERRSFKMLAESYIFFKDTKPTLHEAVDFIASRFKSSTDAYSLKSNLLEPGKSVKNYFLPKYQEREILFFLSTTSLYSSLDFAKLKYQNRFFDFFNNSPSQAIELLEEILKDEPNVFGEDFFRMISTQHELLSIADLLGDKPNLTTVLVTLNPALTYAKDFWKNHSSQQMEIIQTLQRIDDGKIDWEKIIGLLLDGRATVNPKIFELQEKKVAATILNWIDRNHDTPLDYIWSNYLENNPQDVILWMRNNNSPSPYGSSFVINFLNPNSKIVISNGAEPWLTIIKIVNQAENHWLKPNLASFCLPLSFNLSGNDALKLLIFSFETVYQLLGKNQVPFRYWNFLEIHTKTLSIFKDWDKCKKIIHALVDHALENDFDIEYIVEKMEDYRLQDRILRRYHKMK